MGRPFLLVWNHPNQLSFPFDQTLTPAFDAILNAPNFIG